MKRLQHQQHGFGFAHNQLEEEAMRKAGWTDEAQPVATPQEDEQQAAIEAQAPAGVAPTRKKPGPKPKV